MVPVRRLVWTAVVACLVAACGSTAPGPTGAVLSATGQPPAATPGPCIAAVSSLGAFTKRLQDDLAAVRTPLTKTPFDASDTAAASFRVSATITAYKNGEMAAVLDACAATAPLTPRVAKLIAAADKALEQARAASITNAKTQKAAATSLVALLPDVQAIAASNNDVTASLGVSSAATTGPDNSAAPGAAGNWTASANAYLEDAYDAYGAARAAALELARLDPTLSGVTEAELASRQAEAAQAWATAGTAIARHVATMNDNQARPCYADAYAADRTLATRWQALLQGGVVPAVDTDAGRQALQEADRRPRPDDDLPQGHGRVLRRLSLTRPDSRTWRAGGSSWHRRETADSPSGEPGSRLARRRRPPPIGGRTIPSGSLRRLSATPGMLERRPRRRGSNRFPWRSTRSSSVG